MPSSHAAPPFALRYLPLVLTGCALALAVSPPALAQRTALDELKAFPPAPSGQVRRVIVLPQETDENALKVGIIVGRTMMVDCNRHVLGSRLETRTVEGWGYDYHVVTISDAPVSTRMGCPPGSLSKQFVHGGDEPFLRYNSRLPIVIYTPTDVELRYRIWRAGPEVVAK
ncbi:serine protease inhibitor ecotin [Novosphingobium sp.]|uniref:serine protease inhibitor ecotin n=1 Tax=Novosphingobium sp. TaxID=1874826 RepID=UPI0028AC432C|nr:serine protease inhibitor ecotin [Novosphingobium sp.]